MIYKIEFNNGEADYCTAKDITDFLKSYDLKYGLNIQDVDLISEISDEESQKILIKNIDYNPDGKNDEPENFVLSSLAFSDEFQVIASTQYE